jgi:hypothetical protein
MQRLPTVLLFASVCASAFVVNDELTHLAEPPQLLLLPLLVLLLPLLLLLPLQR